MRIPSGSAPQFSASHPVPPNASASAARATERAFRQLRSRRAFLPVLVLAVLLTGLVVTAAGYVGARSLTLDHVETSMSAGARADLQMLTNQGGPLTASGTTMAIDKSSAPVVLNNNTIAIRELHDLSGQNVTIYVLDGTQLRAIATDISGANGQPALTTTLSGAPYDALLGQCGPSATAGTCHQSYSGQASLAGADYVAAFTPLYDGNGVFIGALSTATPLGTVLAPVNQLAVLLGIVCALLGAIAVVVGLLFFAPLSSTLLRKLDADLTEVATYAADLEHLSRSQVARTHRQERMARQTHEVTRHLDEVLDALEQGQAALRDSTSEIWAGMSQPGHPLDPNSATRLARQAAITAGRIGAATEDARERCRTLVALMNQVIAEGRVLNASGHQVEARAAALRQAIEDVEMTLGAQVVARQYDIEGQPFARRLSSVSKRLFKREDASSEDAQAAQSQVNVPAPVVRPVNPIINPVAGPLGTPRVAPRSMPLQGYSLAGWTNPAAPAVGRGPTDSYGQSQGMARLDGSASRPLEQPFTWPQNAPMTGGPASRVPSEGGPASQPGFAPGPLAGGPPSMIPNAPSQPSPWPAAASQPHGFVPWLRSQPGQQPAAPAQPGQPGQAAPAAQWLGTPAAQNGLDGARSRTPRSDNADRSAGQMSQMGQMGRRAPDSRPFAVSDAASMLPGGLQGMPPAANAASVPNNDWLLSGNRPALPRKPAAEHEPGQPSDPRADVNASLPPREPPRTGWIND